MEEILELRMHGLDAAGACRLSATWMELVSRKCVRSLAAADNVLIAASPALVERESNRFSIQPQPSSTKPKYVRLSISTSASSIRTIPGNRLVPLTRAYT
jgi:hypothetical protein